MFASRMSLRSSKVSASPDNHSSDLDDNLSVLSEDELEERDAEETLPCAECGKDLTTEESSTGCDYKFCNRWYHPSCLAPDVPINKVWFCHLCEDDRSPLHDTISVNNTQEPVVTDSVSQQGIKCVSCKRKVDKNEFIGCSGKCGKEFHGDCVLSESEKEKYFVRKSIDPWYCCVCTQFLQGAIKWGNMTGWVEISEKLDSMYQEIVCWKLNLFEVPKGKAGKDFIIELERLLSELTFRTNWKSLSLKLMHVFMPTMLQRPTSKSKPRQNSKFLKERLIWWSNGDLDSLIKHCRQIQTQLEKKNNVQVVNNQKAFCRLMLQGRVRKALKHINHSERLAGGVHNLSKEVIDQLKIKHPLPGSKDPSVLPDITSDLPDPVLFEGIDAISIQNAARDIDGAGGPSQVSAQIWKHMICSRFHLKESEKLAQTIAEFVKILCTEQLPSEYLTEFLAGRLIPLDKDPGSENPEIRPIGIGEVLRRIASKTVTRFLKNDIQLAAGALQTCSGTESGIEAAIHAMKEHFDQEECEAVLLIDAKNAFNSLNRQVALHTIRERCPAFHSFLKNCYKSPTELFVVDENRNKEMIFGSEGATQGDPAAMAMYSISIQPLIHYLAMNQDRTFPVAKQAWFADDGTGGGPILQLKKMWENVIKIGPKHGYFPKASKSVLIVKGLENLPKAKSVFKETGVQVTIEGDRHLGAVIGSESFKHKFVKKKITSWVKDVEELSVVAKEEPQIAYSAFTKGLSSRWCYIQRTIEGISELFKPLEDAISKSLIPAILGREVSAVERDMLALPLRYGGLGIQNPEKTSDREYVASKKITKQLTELIVNQDQDLSKLDKSLICKTKADLKLEKEIAFAAEKKRIESLITSEPKKRAFMIASEKGSSSWLSALPLRSLGYCLNKKDFRDSLRLRYNWPIPDVCKHCACGKNNSVDHALTCKKGGYVTFRHDILVETEAELLREAKCRNVYTEPSLLPTCPELHSKGTITADGARLDIVATGLYGKNEKTFMDVRITHPNAPSNLSIPVEKLLLKNEAEKKSKYASRVINTERATFIPLVFTTAATTAPECNKFHKRVAELIANKRKEQYGKVLSYIRTRISFAMLKSILVSVHGVRDKQGRKDGGIVFASEVAFGLVPEEKAYECR